MKGQRTVGTIIAILVLFLDAINLNKELPDKSNLPIKWTAEEPLWVKYCDLINNASKYDEKIIATEAVEVINLAKRHDGGEPYFYSSKCDQIDGSKRVVLDVFESYVDPNSDAVNEYKIIKSKAEREKKAKFRVRVIIVGRFFASKKDREYGHLGWAKYKLVALSLESVTEVAESQPWPLEK